MTRAEELYQKAECYLQGYGVKKDKNFAIALFLKAAESGYLPAIERLKELNSSYAVVSETGEEATFQKAECYLQGYGVKKDRNFAIALFLKAAESGYLPAIERLKQLNITLDINSDNREKYTELKDAMYYWGNQIPHGSFKFYFGNDIPEKKLMNAINEFAKSVLSNTVIGLIDLTVFGSSNEGMIFTTTGIHYRELMHGSINIKYADILDVKIIYCDDDDNDRKLVIYLNNGEMIELDSSLFNKTPLCRYLERAKVLAREGKTEFSDICIKRDFMHDAILKIIKTDDFLLPHKERLGIAEIVIALNRTSKTIEDFEEKERITKLVRQKNIDSFIEHYEHLRPVEKKRKLLTWLYKLAKKTEYSYDMFDDFNMHEESRKEINNITRELFLKLSPNRKETSLFFSMGADIKADGYKAFVERYLPELMIAILGKIELYDNLIDRQYSTEELSMEIINIWEDLKNYKEKLEKIKIEKLKRFKEKTGVTDKSLDDFYFFGEGSIIKDSLCNFGKNIGTHNAYTGLNLTNFIATNIAIHIGINVFGYAIGRMLYRHGKISSEGAAEAKTMFEKKYVEICKEFDYLIKTGNERVDNHLLLITQAQKVIYQLEIDITELEAFVG